jgi:hypothetical protein
VIATATSVAVLSSAVIAAIIGAGSSFFTQRYLLSRKAQIDYEFMARKRLYDAIGPLRMQLLFAAKAVVTRTQDHPGERWEMDPSEHYARSFIFRLLRPLAVWQLIERQMAIADFSVDPDAIALLRFNSAAVRMLSGDMVVLAHPGADWTTQSQHLFRDNLQVAASKLIAEEENGSVVIDYGRLQREVPDPRADDALHDLAMIFDRCSYRLTENPLFWLRLVGYAYTCSQLLAAQGGSVGFETPELSTTKLLSSVDDEFIVARVPEYLKVFDEIVARGI